MTLNEALQGGLTDHRIILLSLVMVLAGFVSGLAGFGFSFVAALGLFLFAPRDLFPLLLLLSLVTQAVSIWSLRRSMVPLRQWWSAGPLPFIVGGAVGVPGGLWLLYHLDAQALCELVGVIIVGYAAWSLLAKPRAIAALLPVKARLATGYLGGVVGGFTAAPGSVVAIWGTLTGTGKDQQRGIVQPFIVCSQVFTLVDQLTKPPGIPIAVLTYAAWLSVVVVPANLVGVSLFRRLSDRSFTRIVLFLLLGMGLALVDKGFHVWGELFASWHYWHPQFGRG